MLLFQVFVQPAEEGALPEDAVLWFQHPVVLVGEEEELGVESAHSGCGEGAFGLGVFNSEVSLSVDAEDGCVPFIDVEVGRSGEHLLDRKSVV